MLVVLCLALLTGVLPLLLVEEQASGAATLPAGFKLLHFASGLTAPVDLRVNDDNLYYLSRGNGSLNVIRYAP